ncbi:MAG: glycosyl transferase family 2 [Rhodobacteraceae bacterium]|nr:glycosyl transferase family 2 [Paracoccaceae bacterium]
MPDTPHVIILMAVYNGEAALADQLDSIAAQTHENWHLVASDDGSTDRSAEILSRFAQDHPVTILRGPGQGAARNFLSLLDHATEAFPGSWVALSDQDDHWYPDKLARACVALSPGQPDQPALYCSRVMIADADLAPLKPSPARPRPPGFLNALVQNIVPGNTVVLNPAAARLAGEVAGRVDRVVVHDWWLYQLVTGAGGRIHHDDAPSLLYRQHAANEIGANDGLAARLARIGMIFDGTYRAWNDINIAALDLAADRLTPQSALTLAHFKAARSRGLFGRVRGFARLGLYRQTWASSATLWLQIVLGRC